MRTALILAFAASAFCVVPAAAQHRNDGVFIEVKPRSWLDPGTEVRPGRGLDYATSNVFGGGAVNGASSRGMQNLPRDATGPLVTFPFLGANVVR